MVYHEIISLINDRNDDTDLDQALFHDSITLELSY